MGYAGSKGYERLMKKIIILLVLLCSYPCYAIISGFGGGGGGGGASVEEPTVAAYWSFDSEDWVDEETRGGGSPLTLTNYNSNATFETSSPITGAASASYDGVSSYTYILYSDWHAANLPMSGTSYRDVSICAQFSFDSAISGSVANLISKYNTDSKRTLLIRKNSDDKMEVLHGPAGGGTPTSYGTHATGLTHSTNYGVCYTEDGTTADWTLDVYNVDTSSAVGSQASGTWGNVLNIEDVNFFISGREPSGTDDWDGLIDEVKIYGTPLTSDQVEAYFAGDFF